MCTLVMRTPISFVEEEFIDPSVNRKATRVVCRDGMRQVVWRRQSIYSQASQKKLRSVFCKLSLLDLGAFEKLRHPIYENQRTCIFAINSTSNPNIPAQHIVSNPATTIIITNKQSGLWSILGEAIALRHNLGFDIGETHSKSKEHLIVSMDQTKHSRQPQNNKVCLVEVLHSVVAITITLRSRYV